MSAETLTQKARFSVFGKAWLGLLTAGVMAPPVGAQWNPFAAAQRRHAVRAEQAATEAELSRLPEPRVTAQAHQRFGFHGRPGDPAVITLDLGRWVRPDEVVLFPARVSDPTPDDPVGGFPPEVRCLLSATGADGTFAVINEWREDSLGAGRDLPLLRLRGNGAAGRFLRLEIRGAWARTRGQFFALGEIVVLEGGANRALGADVVTGPSIETPPRWAAANLTDGFLWCRALSGMRRSRQNGFHSAIEAAPDAGPKWVEVDLGETLAVDEVRLVPARPVDYADVAGFGFPPTFQVIAFADETDASPVFHFDTADAGPIQILMDIGLPGMSGLEGIGAVRARWPACEVVVFTVFDDAEKIYAAICAGASGYLLKSEPTASVIAAVEEVRRGGSPMHPQVARKILDRLSGRHRPAPETQISEREREVLQSMVEGLTKKEIAAQLDLSIHTVDNYLRRIYRKLHVNTMQGAVAKAMRDGLL